MILKKVLFTSLCLFFFLVMQAQLNVPIENTPPVPEYLSVPNTSVKIIPPAHFHYIDDMGGFLHVGTSSSVQVQEIIGTAYTLIIKGLTEEHFESQGVKLISKEEVITKNNEKGVMFKVSFIVDDFEFERLMFFTGDYNRTIWINANYPVVVKEMLEVVLKESLLTAKFIE